MMLYPDAQKRCQDQLDEVIGSDRLPQFTDRDSLPLLECTLKETFRSVKHAQSTVHTYSRVPARWHPPLPIAVPHYAAVEDEYKGMRIPAGAAVIANAR